MTIFEPIYLSGISLLSVESCRRELDTYYCTDAKLKKPEMFALEHNYYHNNGIIVLNSNQDATTKDIAKYYTSRKIRGPAVCTSNESSSVIIDNQIFYLHMSEFHIKQEILNFDVPPYPVTLIFATKSPQELESQMALSGSSNEVLHASHFAMTLILMTIIISTTIIVFCYLKKHHGVFTSLKNEGFPLQEILVIEDTKTGQGRTRTVRRA